MKDSDLQFNVPTDCPMFFVRGSFSSYLNFYLGICNGFGMDYALANFYIMDNVILISDYHKRFQN